MQEFKGKVAVVTGAASGTGLAATERFLAEGMTVGWPGNQEIQL